MQFIFGKSALQENNKMTTSFDDCYDSSWHLIPPDYVSNEEDYRQA